MWIPHSTDILKKAESVKYKSRPFANLPNPGTFTEILSQSSVVRVRDFRVLLRLRGLKRSFLLNITDWTDPLWFSRWSLMKEILTKCQRVTGEGALLENPSWRNCHPWRMICNEIFILFPQKKGKCPPVRGALSGVGPGKSAWSVSCKSTLKITDKIKCVNPDFQYEETPTVSAPECRSCLPSHESGTSRSDSSNPSKEKY